MKYALVFPGQGAQEVGMGKALFDNFASARDVFNEVDESLGFPLSKIIFEGPEEELRLTAYTQPSILAVGIAALRVLEKDMGMELSPALAAGHSLGEYTALVASGSISLKDGATIVHLRGKWMQEAVPQGEGAMAAIMGVEAEELKKICAEVSPNGECQPANFNAPGQIVISGAASFVDKAVALAKERGAKRAVPLNVSAPFHSKLMRPVAHKLDEQFEKCKWNEPKYPIVSNAWAKPLSNVAEIRKALYEQTYSPVLWEDSVIEMANSGIENFIELGPGNVLAGLIKRCRKGLNCISACTPETLATVKATLNG